MAPIHERRIGVDLGGTKIEAIALSAAGETLARSRVATPRGDYGATVSAVAELVRRTEREAGAEDPAAPGIGIGIPGALSRHNGRIKNANSTWLIGRPFDRDLERALGRPVRLANDANCFALSEARDDERPGPPCYCGKAGCIETFLSGVGLARDHEAAGGRARSANEVAAAAAAGDPAAGAALARYHDRLARALAHVVNVLDPEMIVVGGGLSNLDSLYREVPARLPAYVFSDRVDTQIVAPRHGDSSGVRGAAWLWPASGEPAP